MSRAGSTFGSPKLLAAGAFLIAASLPALAQFGPPPTTTSIGGHALAPPASVTSISSAHAPPVLPSVTSIPNSGFNYHYNYGPYFNGHNGRRNGNGYGGYGYAVPYYYPADGSNYGYDYVGGGGGGPDLYSGPPIGNESVLHVIVEQPPAGAYAPPEPRPRAQVAPPDPAPSAPEAELRPNEPTVLVYRDGKKQEVTNYAIMGETLYVFDPTRKKIAMSDLDIQATIKANDDRGLEFRMPATPAKKKAAAPTPQTATPDTSDDGQPKKIAALNP